MYKRIILLLLCAFLCTEVMASDSLSVSLSVYKEKEEWNFSNIRLYLRNLSGTPLQNPVVTYFADFVADLDASADYSTWPIDAKISVTPAASYSMVNVAFKGTLMPGKTQQADIRIYKKKWDKLDSKNDWSYQKNVRIYEPGYTWTVRDGKGNLLWGIDPVTKESMVDAFLWDNNDGTKIISKYNGEYEKVGGVKSRFWLVKDVLMTAKEKKYLADIGVSTLNAAPYMDKSLYLMTAKKEISKKILNDSLTGFYNAFAVSNADAQKLSMQENDKYETIEVCDKNGKCEKQVRARDSYDLIISCWEDISKNKCSQIVQDCGIKISYTEINDVVATVKKELVSCLENNADIRSINLVAKEWPTNDNAVKSVHLNNLQSNFDFSSTFVSDKWMSGKKYTGEGIVIGIYDTGVDFDHPFFREYKNNDDKVGTPRKAADAELHFNGEFKSMANDSYKGNHGTHVAGIAAGNGNGTGNLKYHGIAPKAHIYNFDGWGQQVGNVTNHSHALEVYGGYSATAKEIDENIFYNWKKGSSGDTVTKAVVVTAGNQGYDAQYGTQKGYHSIGNVSKNTINVGMYSSMTGIRHSGSSLGPTWDGRIKPDIMAPGNSVIYSFTGDADFGVNVQSVRVLRNGSQVVFEENFDEYDKNSSIVSVGNNIGSYIVENWNASNPIVVEDNEGKAFSFKCNSNYGDGVYLTFKAKTPFVMKKDDVIEWKIRYTGSKKLDFPYLFTEAHMSWSTGDDMYKNKKVAAEAGGRTEAEADKINNETPFHNEQNLFFFNDGGKDFTKDYVTNKFTWTLDEDKKITFFRLSFNFSIGAISSVPVEVVHDKEWTPELDSRAHIAMMSGTSMAAPVVTGIVALMEQEYRNVQEGRESIKAMRNSTIKGILIHTAEDMISYGDHGRENPDLNAAHHDGKNHFTRYGKGPDFATGWGKVDAERALSTVSNEFFKEIEIKQNMEKRWNVEVNAGKPRLRTTLVWDDYPSYNFLDPDGNPAVLFSSSYKKKRLVNDLDMYLISPSGKMYYPWRLDPLPTKYLPVPLKKGDKETDEEFEKRQKENDASRASGLEEIYESDLKDAYNTCVKSNKLDKSCFDHLNNVEVVDVENPEAGVWQIVVRGYNVYKGNDEEEISQIASLISDAKIVEPKNACEVSHPYVANENFECVYGLGRNLRNYVTFDSRTSLASGDKIELRDANNKLLGTYTGKQLAGKEILVNSTKLKVKLISQKNSSTDWGFGVNKIRSIPLPFMPMFYRK